MKDAMREKYRELLHAAVADGTIGEYTLRGDGMNTRATVVTRGGVRFFLRWDEVELWLKRRRQLVQER